MERKSFLNKICMWLCALVMVVTLFGNVDCVRASDVGLNSYLSACGLPRSSEFENEYRYIFVDIETKNLLQVYRVEAGDVSFYMEKVYSTNPDYFYGICRPGQSVVYSIYTLDMSDSSPEWKKAYGPLKTDSALGAISYPATYKSMRSYYTDIDIYTDSNFNTIFYPAGSYTLYDYGKVDSVPLPKYASSVGYLQNVKRKLLYKYGENYTVDAESAVHRISFDSTSTTGNDITDGNWVVRVYEQMAVYKRSEPTVNCFPYLPRVLVGEFPAENLTFDYNVQDALTLTTEETGEVDGYNAISIVMNGYVRSDSIYYQLYNKLTGEYGGYVLIKGDGTESNVGSGTGTTVTPEGDIDDGGYIETPVGGGTGIGSNYDDAEHDANESVSDGTLGDAMNVLEGTLNEFTSSVKIVPKVVAECFSFLPDWCLKMFGATIGLACLLIIWKLL